MTKDIAHMIAFWNVALLNSIFMAVHNYKSFSSPMFVINFSLMCMFVFLALRQYAKITEKDDD